MCKAYQPPLKHVKTSIVLWQGAMTALGCPLDSQENESQIKKKSKDI